MLDLLITIYIDPHETLNIRHEFRKLIMRSSQPFSEFHTRFMHLTGLAKIPAADWQPELYDKLTIDLQKAVLPTIDTLSIYKALTDRCRLLDQDLRRIQERSNRLKTRTITPNRTVSPTTQPTTTAAKPPINIDRLRPVYDNPERQVFNRAGRCFLCQ